MSDDLLVTDLTACSYQISMADRAALRLTRVASVHIKVLARGDEVTVTLKKVYLAPRLAKNIVSYEKVKI